MKQILIIVGTRPEAIKLIPVYFALQRLKNFKVMLLATGQHREMLDQIFDFFQVVPDFDLNVMTANQSLAELSANLFRTLDDTIRTVHPDLVIVQGDTTSAMVGSLVSFYHKIRIAHVEAGLRSNNKWAPFPEEANRRIISQVCDMHFAPTKLALENLEREGMSNVHLVGNTVVDSLLLGRDIVYRNASLYEDKFSDVLKAKKLILITAHRRESIGDNVNSISQAIKSLATQYRDCHFVVVLHRNPNFQHAINSVLSGAPGVTLMMPLNYDEMIFIMSKAYIILSDSGGIQEEAPSLRVPIIVLRDVTERPEGLDAGCAVLAGTDQHQIEQTFSTLYNDKVAYNKMLLMNNPYGDGKASEYIAEKIEHYL